MASPPTTITDLSMDSLQNILARLPAVDFASANGASSFLHHGCRSVLCRPKFSSACSLNPNLQFAVEEVVNKILSEPMRPHFAIASIGYIDNLEEAERLIKAKLGSNFPIITHSSNGFMASDALSEEFKEARWDTFGVKTGIMLMVGFLPGIEVKNIPLLMPQQICTYKKTNIIEKLNYEMSPETVIVGDFDCGLNKQIGTAAVALVFVKDMNKPSGIGETQFHSVSSSGMLPLGSTYEGLNYGSFAWHTASREGLRYRYRRRWYIGVTKRRKCPTGQEKVGLMTSFAFRQVISAKDVIIGINGGLETGDTFRFYIPDSATALSSAANVSNHLGSFKQGSSDGGDKREVFGGLIFTSCARDESFFGQASVESSSFLDNFPGVTLALTLCEANIGRDDLNTYVKESQEQKSLVSCVNEFGATYLIMSYTP